MKKLLLTAICTVMLIVASSCETNSKPILKSSTGNMNSLLVVMNNSEWKGKAGDALREIIATPVVGLPQDENQFTVHQVAPKTFSQLFQSSRNILFVGVDKSNTYNVNTNLYASPQLAMTILGKDEQSLINQINKHKKDIVSVFKEGDLAFFQKKLTKEEFKTDTLKTINELGISMRIPKDYRLVADKGDFLWMRYESGDASKNLLVYSHPLTKPLDSIDMIIPSMRNAIGEKFIPGEPDGSYMITEAAYSPFIVKTKLGDKEAFETRGKWEVKGDYMAGPFLNYAVVDKKNNRLVVVEGFTYAPNAKKRDYMFELEAILKTLKV